MVSIEKDYFDIIDSDDDISQYKSIRNRLKTINDLIANEFFKNDYDANEFQFYYKYIVIPLAICFGTLAILIAYMQLTDILIIPKWLPFLETFFAVSLLVIVFSGTKIQNKWLISRFKAESLRDLKFRSLIDPLVWSGNNEAWESNLTTIIKKIKQFDIHSLHSVVSTRNTHKETLSSDISWDKLEVIVDTVHYYQKKRIDFQIKYFERKYVSKKRIDQVIAKLPFWFFILSLTMVIVHFGLIFFDEAGFLAEVSILFVVILSLLGISIRTLRSSLELARHAYLYEYKKDFLSQMSVDISRILTEKPVNYPQKLLEILNDCEISLEEEHYEWLRLMIEADWYL